jgi:hypothetical protein
MEKLFTVAGTSNLNGAVKFRFANDFKGRVKVLERNGHTDIMLFELPRPMTKEEAIAHLEGMDVAAPAAVAETAATVKASLADSGDLAEDMTEEFLAEVAARENAK